jgi:hypothetical protein
MGVWARTNFVEGLSNAFGCFAAMVSDLLEKSRLNMRKPSRRSIGANWGVKGLALINAQTTTFRIGKPVNRSADVTTSNRWATSPKVASEISGSKMQED